MKTIKALLMIGLLLTLSCHRAENLQQKNTKGGKSEVIFPDIIKRGFIQTRYYDKVVINNKEELVNNYSLKAIYVEAANPLRIWVFKKGLEGRAFALSYNREVKVLSDMLGEKEIPFVFYTDIPGAHKFQFIVTDKYGNVFESRIYEVVFEN